ncbi:hypothetical protein E2C01_088898 [Portunus trituberculatus]|uniref:Uncharacterized protein n=1 Tax=Portunus trituberculatus TaxID=210409 RepID=A0A5B7JKU2_PORTR|nr:hypothetical protein [Portunus trituberculatus]
MCQHQQEVLNDVSNQKLLQDSAFSHHPSLGQQEMLLSIIFLYLEKALELAWLHNYLQHCPARVNQIPGLEVKLSGATSTGEHTRHSTPSVGNELRRLSRFGRKCPET